MKNLRIVSHWTGNPETHIQTTNDIVPNMNTVLLIVLNRQGACREPEGCSTTGHGSVLPCTFPRRGKRSAQTLPGRRGAQLWGWGRAGGTAASLVAPAPFTASLTANRKYRAWKIPMPPAPMPKHTITWEPRKRSLCVLYHIHRHWRTESRALFKKKQKNNSGNKTQQTINQLHFSDIWSKEGEALRSFYFITKPPSSWWCWELGPWN